MKICNTLFRRATPEDDVSAIARYVYLTDPFIYPAIADSPSDSEWLKLFEECYKMPDNLFSYKNLYLALQDGRVIGICCMIPCGIRHKFSEGLQLSPALSTRISDVNDGYFAPLLNESANMFGYNIVNLCIDEKFRGLGIGTGLLKYCINSHKPQTFYIDVIADNASAVSVYRSLGFKILKEYEGFSGKRSSVLCYQMKLIAESPLS